MQPDGKLQGEEPVVRDAERQSRPSKTAREPFQAVCESPATRARAGMRSGRGQCPAKWSPPAAAVPRSTGVPGDRKSWPGGRSGQRWKSLWPFISPRRSSSPALGRPARHERVAEGLAAPPRPGVLAAPASAATLILLRKMARSGRSAVRKERKGVERSSTRSNEAPSWIDHRGTVSAKRRWWIAGSRADPRAPRWDGSAARHIDGRRCGRARPARAAPGRRWRHRRIKRVGSTVG